LFDQHISAIFYVPEAAQGARLAFLQGLRVRQDVSLVTFNDEPVNAGYFPLTTCVLSEYEVGEQAVDMPLSHIARPGSYLPCPAFPSLCSPGESSAPPH